MWRNGLYPSTRTALWLHPHSIRLMGHVFSQLARDHVLRTVHILDPFVCRADRFLCWVQQFGNPRFHCL